MAFTSAVHLRLRADGDPYEIPNPIRIKPADQNSAFLQPAVQLPAGNGGPSRRKMKLV